MANSHIADKVRSIMAKRRMGTGHTGNVVPRPKAKGKPTMAPMDEGEYVLPKEAVAAMGGPDAIDQHVMQTLKTLQPPSGSVAKGYRTGGRYQYYGGRHSGEISGNQDFSGNAFFHGGVDIPPADMRDPFGGHQGYNNRSYNPSLLTQVGMPWSPTLLPTTYNPQGFPRAVPVYTPSGPDQNLQGVGRTNNLRKTE